MGWPSESLREVSVGLAFFLKGFIIGISIAAPVGPVGVLCIQRSLTGGWIHGLISGLGAATADAVYGSIAAFGLTVISSFLCSQHAWFRLIGGAFLCYLGIRAFLSEPARAAPVKQRLSRIGAYGSTFILTVTNPMTILSFAAIFAGLGLVDQGLHYSRAILMVIGVFMGSGLWWVVLSGVSTQFRERLTHKKMAWVNRISGTIITAFGVVVLISLMV